MNQREENIRRRIRAFTLIFIIGLILSGATAIPLVSEVDMLARITGAAQMKQPAAWTVWLLKVQKALHSVSESYPFLFYGGDWLAFGHFVIAIAFVGALRDPVRNL